MAGGMEERVRMVFHPAMVFRSGSSHGSTRAPDFIMTAARRLLVFPLLIEVLLEVQAELHGERRRLGESRIQRVKVPE